MIRRLLLLSLIATAPARAAPPLAPADRASAETLLSALAADPFAEEPFVALGRIYARGPGAAGLVAECRRRTEAEPANLAFHVVLARAELESGNHAEAVRQLERAADLERAPADARRLARVLDDNGVRAAAIKSYRVGLAGATPTEQRLIQLRLGVLLWADGKPADARAAWAEAKRLSPGDVALRRQIVEALASRGAWKDALAELRDVESLVAGDAAAQVALARREAELWRRVPDRRQAAQALVRGWLAASEAGQSALEAELAADLLRLYAVGRKVQVPDELLQVLAAAEKQTPRAAALRGEALITRGDPAGALESYRKAQTAAPRDLFVLRRLCALETGEARLKDLSALGALAPEDALAQLDRVRALFDAGRAGQALDAARAVRHRFNDDAPILDELGGLLLDRGQPAEALPVLERELALEKDQPEALVRYGDALLALKRDQEAQRVYFRLVERDHSAVGYRQLIEVLGRRNLPAAVRQAYVQAMANAPDDQTLRRDYARFLGSHGFVEEAMAEWKKLRDGARDAFLRDYAARELKRLEWESMLNR